MVTDWVGTNLVEAPGASPGVGPYEWAFHVDNCASMYQSYASSCMFARILEAPPPGARIDVVRAERSGPWGDEVRTTLTRCTPPLTPLHHLPPCRARIRSTHKPPSTQRPRQEMLQNQLRHQNQLQLATPTPAALVLTAWVCARRTAGERAAGEAAHGGQCPHARTRKRGPLGANGQPHRSSPAHGSLLRTGQLDATGLSACVLYGLARAQGMELTGRGERARSREVSWSWRQLSCSSNTHLYTPPRLRSLACGCPRTLHPPPVVEFTHCCDPTRGNTWLGASGPRQAVAVHRPTHRRAARALGIACSIHCREL
jgi:hypothetical protein